MLVASKTLAVSERDSWQIHILEKSLETQDFPKTFEKIGVNGGIW